MNLTQNRLGSGIKEQRSSQGRAASLQEGISGCKKGQELDFALLWPRECLYLSSRHTVGSALLSSTGAAPGRTAWNHGMV